MALVGALPSQEGFAQGSRSRKVTYRNSYPNSHATSRSTVNNSQYVGPSTFEIGIMIGDPTGLSAKFRTAPDRAVDAGLSYSAGNYIELISDYFWQFPNAFANASQGSISTDFVPYVGLGIACLFSSGNRAERSANAYRGQNLSNTAVGPRIPLGMEYLPKSLPLSFFAEIVPGTLLFPDSAPFVEGGVGARFRL